METTEQNHKALVSAKVKELFENYLNKGLIPIANSSIDIVKFGGNRIRADVQCIFCERYRKKIRVQCENRGKTALYFNYNNLKKHLKLHMTKKASEIVHQIQLLPIVIGENENDTVADTIQVESDPYNAKLAIFPTTLPQENEIVLIAENSPRDLISKQCIVQHIPLSVSAAAQQLYDRFSSQISSLAGTCSNEQQKIMMFKREATNRYGTVKIVSTLPDGNCLFAACIHQLYTVEVGSDAHKDLTSGLRHEISEYIKVNLPYFEHVIKQRIQNDTVYLAERNCTWNNFVEHLSSPGFWGGSESLLAISKIYSANIVVFDENGPYYFATPYHEEHTRTVFLAYREYFDSGERTRKHYDSICEISNIVLSNCSVDLCSKGLNESVVLFID